MIFRKTILTVALAALCASCVNNDYSSSSPFDNQVFIDVAATTRTAVVSFDQKATSLERKFKAVTSSRVAENTEVTFALNPGLVATYNHRYGTSYQMLDASRVTLPTTKCVIPAGKNESPMLSINFTGLTELEVDKTFLVPLTLASATGDLTVLDGSRTVYYLVRRSSSITTAANLSDCYLWVKNFETPSGAVVNKLSAVTYESWINVKEFKNTISTIMGVEMHCMLRFGDTNYERQQLQAQIGATKFPASSKVKKLEANTWYHVAMTWDVTTGAACIYVNGTLQSEAEVSWPDATIDLAMNIKDARRFFIGYSYDPQRPLQGLIAETRIWSTARTQEQIRECMYNVDPEAPGLCAYWKFNEGEGNAAIDQTGHGNDAICMDGTNNFETGGRVEGTLKWVSVDVPQLDFSK